MKEDIINTHTAGIWVVIGNRKLFLYLFLFPAVTIHYFCYEGEAYKY